MLILNNIDAGFLIAPETTNTGDRFLGVQRIKIRYNAGNMEFVYLPFVGNTLKLKEDFGGLAAFKTTMRADPQFGSGMPMQSQYQTNAIVDMGQITKFTSTNSNIFSAKVVSNDIEDLEPEQHEGMRVLIDPMIYFN